MLKGPPFWNVKFSFISIDNFKRVVKPTSTHLKEERNSTLMGRLLMQWKNGGKYNNKISTLLDLINVFNAATSVLQCVGNTKT